MIVAQCYVERLRIFADSDAMITRGIIALLLRCWMATRPEEIVDADLYFLTETGLATQLSPSRANGLAAMVQRIQRRQGDPRVRRRKAGEDRKIHPTGTVVTVCSA